MADESKNKDAGQRPVPEYKRFGGAKLVPPPAPIQQPNDEEKFPVFLGVGIAVSIVALISVFVLAAFSHKTKVNVPSPDGPAAAQTASPSSTATVPKNPHY